MKRIKNLIGFLCSPEILLSLSLLNLAISLNLQLEISKAFDIIGTMIQAENATLKIINTIIDKQHLLTDWLDSIQSAIS
jgi:hypothetical protein